MARKYSVAVFIGRFQPFHIGHEAVIREGLKQADIVAVGIGSAFAARSIRNPWTYHERLYSIKSVIKDPHVKFFPIPDYPYDENKWIAAVQSGVMSVLDWTPDPVNVALIGHSKDHSSYYLNIFPNWSSIEVPDTTGASSTPIREEFLRDHFLTEKTANMIPMGSILRASPQEFNRVFEDFKMVEEYRKGWKDAPYPPTFVTVDAVVVQSGHILLIERGASPGKGLIALPGGFVGQHETLLDAAIRELREETGIKVPVPVLKGSIRDHRTFDSPYRSSRGRTITTAYYIDLGYHEKLPKIKGGDDAAKAKWVPFNSVDPQQMFEDHAHIADYFLNIR